MAFWIPYHIWTPHHHHHPFHLADDFKHFISHLSHHVLLSTLKGEGRKWLIALIKRDISHFRSCIKEVIIPSPLSPQFPHFPAFPSFSLSPSPSPASHKTTIWWYWSLGALLGADILLEVLRSSGLFVFHALQALKLCDPRKWPVPQCQYPAPHLSIIHVSMIQTSMIHDTCIDDGCFYYISTM